MKHHYLVFFVYFILGISADAQSIAQVNLQAKQFQDAYNQALNQQEYDEALVHLNALSDLLIYQAIDHQRSYSLLRDFKPYLKFCQTPKQRANFYINYAESATYNQYYKEAMQILEEGISYMEKEQDSSWYAFGYAYLKAAENTNRLNRFTESATYFQKAESLFSHQQDSLMLLWTKSGLSTLFSSFALYDKAAKEREFIFNMPKKPGFAQVKAVAHLRAATDAFFQNQPQKELYHIEQALKTENNQADIKEIVRLISLTFATAIYARNQQKDKANHYFKELQTQFSEHKLQTPFINSYYRLAQSRHALVNNQIDLAISSAHDLLESLENTDDWQHLARAYWLLANIYEENQQTPKALYYLKRYTHLKDSVNVAASRRQFAFVQTQFETKKKDLALKQKNQAIELLHAKNRIVNQRLLLLGIISLFGFVFLYIWRQRLYAQRKERLQKEFAHNLVHQLEDERKRIAGELHDSVGQNLLLVKNKLLLKKQQEHQLLEESIQEVRSMSQRLHPFQFEKLGLLTSIKHTVERFQKNSGIYYSTLIETQHINLKKEKAILIFRMIQECLNNVEKHSQASACQVRIQETSETYIFSIKDNGLGFEVSQQMQKLDSLGLKNLKERAVLIEAKLKIRSRREKGTHISIILNKHAN